MTETPQHIDEDPVYRVGAVQAAWRLGRKAVGADEDGTVLPSAEPAMTSDEWFEGRHLERTPRRSDC